MKGYQLEPLNDENAREWEEFNATAADGSIFHSLQWRPIAEQCSGEPWHCFLLRRDGEVVGLYPLVAHTIYGFRGYAPAAYPMVLHAVLDNYRDPLATRAVLDGLRRTTIGRSNISFVCPVSLREEVFDTINDLPGLPLSS